MLSVEPVEFIIVKYGCRTADPAEVKQTDQFFKPQDFVSFRRRPAQKREIVA